MTDKKFTDEEIKKALERACSANNICNECPVRSVQFLAEKALDLINRYETENKKLKNALETAIDCIGECEYACHKVYNSRIEVAVNDWETYAETHNVDNLLKETEREG